MDDGHELRVLCASCRKNYELAGYIVEKVGFMSEECDMCSRLGQECVILNETRKRNGRRRKG